jgi:hypothetical protein
MNRGDARTSPRFRTEKLTRTKLICDSDSEAWLPEIRPHCEADDSSSSSSSS